MQIQRTCRGSDLVPPGDKVLSLTQINSPNRAVQPCLTSHSAHNPQPYHAYMLRHPSSHACMHSSSKPPPGSCHMAPQVVILTSRCVRTRRFSALSYQRIIEGLVVALLAGLFWWQIGGKSQLDEAKVNDIAGLLFFEVGDQVQAQVFSGCFVLLCYPLILQVNSDILTLTGQYGSSTQWHCGRVKMTQPSECTSVPSRGHVLQGT